MSNVFKLNLKFMIVFACNSLINHCLGASLLIIYHGVIVVESFHRCLFSLSTSYYVLRSIEFDCGRNVFGPLVSTSSK